MYAGFLLIFLMLVLFTLFGAAFAWCVQLISNMPQSEEPVAPSKQIASDCR